MPHKPSFDPRHAWAAFAALALATLACNLLPPAGAVLDVTPVTDPGVLMAPLLLEDASAVLTKRLAAAGIAGRADVSEDRARIALSLKDEKDVEVVKGLVSRVGALALVNVGDSPVPEGTTLGEDVTPILSSKDVASAALTLDQFGNPQVRVSFTPAGAQTLAEFTQAAVGHYLAIAVDGRVLTAPRIQTPITDGQAVITSPGLPVDAALLLAALLNSGPLPLALQVESVAIR